jgi:hypothetical protein
MFVPSENNYVNSHNKQTIIINIKMYKVKEDWGSSVSIETDCGLDKQGSISSRDKGFFF